MIASAALVLGATAAASLQAPPLRPSASLALDTIVTIEASSSTLEFDPPTLAFKQGIQVRLRLVNTGTLPHNFVLVRNEADIDALAAAAMKQGGDYVPTELKDKLIAWTALASPGETVEVSFTVPPPGSYTYVCLMSGHAVSMLGTLRSLH